jgi:hypothetical protein
LRFNFFWKAPMLALECSNNKILLPQHLVQRLDN